MDQYQKTNMDLHLICQTFNFDLILKTIFSSLSKQKESYIEHIISCCHQNCIVRVGVTPKGDPHLFHFSREITVGGFDNGQMATHGFKGSWWPNWHHHSSRTPHFPLGLCQTFNAGSQKKKTRPNITKISRIKPTNYFSRPLIPLKLHWFLWQKSTFIFRCIFF